MAMFGDLYRVCAQIKGQYKMARATIVREPAMWPSFCEQFVVLVPGSFTMTEIARFQRERDAIEYRNTYNEIAGSK